MIGQVLDLAAAAGVQQLSHAGALLLWVVQGPAMLAAAAAEETTLWRFLAGSSDVLVLGLAAGGSALGIGFMGQAAAGAWAKEARSGQPLSFTYIVLMGMPLSQTLYALILMLQMRTALDQPELAMGAGGLLLGIGIAGGLAEMLSAVGQGLIGAAGIRAISEGQGKGFAFVIIAMGIAETVGIFAMVFMLIMIP
jgi:V/A-type H+/Na+-transporting ATPase subunit K